MTIASGTKLGPYEILSPLGAGGMGEVYKARDTRLGRDVAVKVLPEEFFEDEERRIRFEREARMLAALNHPGIAAIHSFEETPGSPGSASRHILVMEMVEGETLEEKIRRSPLPFEDVVSLGRQIAEALEAAHEKGIVHRDLKPANVRVCEDGKVKLLDFGLAKALEGGSSKGDSGGGVTKSPTLTARATAAGVILGTAAYMSPEQARGKTVDKRTDIWAFGCVLYEMLSGKRAFEGETVSDTLAAVLMKDPDWTALPKETPTGVRTLLRKCLQRDARQRLHDIGDARLELEEAATTPPASSPSSPSVFPFEAAPGGSPSGGFPSRSRFVFFLPWILAAAFAAAAGTIALRARAPVRVPSFAQLTFRQEPIFNARLAPDGKTVVYSAAPSGNAPEIFSLRSDYPGASPRSLRAGHLLSISSRGELAVLTRARYVRHSFFEGTLARMPLEGGAPREILDGVREADWSPDGAELAVIRDVGGKDRLEFPAGKVLCETGGYFSNPRFSPRGDRIAFFQHPIKYDDRGEVAVVDLAGKKTILSEGYWGEEGLAWSPGGDEVMFSAGTAYNNFRVYAVNLKGERRVALESAGGLTIQDIRGDGRWLATRDDFFREMPVLAPGQTRERDLSWLDLSDPSAMTPEGKTLLFTEESGSVGVNYAVCLRHTDGSPVVRLGEGFAADLSRDGKFALANVPTTPQQLVVYPTGAGEPRRLERGGLLSYESAQFFPDGKRVLACGHEEGHGVRCYVQEIVGGKPRPLTPEGTTLGFVSPDGRQIVVRASGGGLLLYQVDGGEPRPVPGANADDAVIRWSADGRFLLVCRTWEVPARIERLELSSGKRELFRTVGPTNLTGVLQIGTFAFSDDGKSYAYSCRRMVSHLFLVEGAR